MVSFAHGIRPNYNVSFIASFPGAGLLQREFYCGMTFDPLLRYKEAYNTTSLPAPPFHVRMRESGKTL